MTTAIAVKLSQMPQDQRSAFLDSVLGELETKSLKDIAKARKVSPFTLCRYLLIERSDELKVSVAAKAFLEHEKAVEALQDSNDMFKMNRAEKIIKAMQWQLERTHRKIYGQDAQPPAASVQINIGIRRGVTVEHEVEGEVLNGRKP